MSFSDDEDAFVEGPGWEELKKSVEKLTENFKLVSEALIIIVNIENAKLVSNGQAVIPDTHRRILQNEVKFIEKFKEKLNGYKRSELAQDENSPEYVGLYKTLTSSVNDHVDVLLSEITKQITIKTSAENELIAENKKLMESNRDLEGKQMKENISHEKTKAELNTMRVRSNKLQEQVEAKTNEIAQLKRAGTVALWNREKKKLEDEIKSRETQLETQLEIVTEDSTESIERLRAKVTELQEEISKMKTRREINKNNLSKSELDQLKRALFIKERSLIIAESEIKKQQRYFYGLFSGLQRDYDIILSLEKTEHQDKYNMKQKDYKEKIKKVLKAVEEGKVSELRSSLPAHYLGVQVMFKGSPISNSLFARSTLYVDSLYDEIDLDEVPANPNLYNWRDADYLSPSIGKLLLDIDKKHPKLILRDGALMMKEAITYFPSITEKKIREYFTIFKELDENGDLSLDTSEILHSLPSLIGKLGTINEVADAIREVDIDDSGTIDFFEFLLLIQILQHGGGQAKLFQKKAVKDLQKTTDSSSTKVCIIQ